MSHLEYNSVLLTITSYNFYVGGVDPSSGPLSYADLYYVYFTDRYSRLVSILARWRKFPL
jgi:hypothetical protein